MSLINKDQIVDPDIAAALIDAEKKTAAYVTQLKALAKQAEAVNKAIGNSQSWGDLNKAIDQNIEVTNEVISKQREAILVQQEELKLKQLQRKETNELAKSEEKLRKEQEKQKKTTEDNNSLWKKNTDQLAKLKKEAREAALAYGENSKEAKKAATAANELGDKMAKIDASIGNHQRNVGNYGSVWKDVKSNLVGVATGIAGVAAVIGGITSLVQRAWKNTVDFGKALSSLQAITGSTAKDMKFFATEAIKMSNQTQKSANEIVKAFELVGSKAPELLKSRDALKDVTKWSIILAESSGGQLELSKSVESVTAAMAVFNLGADEAGRIANILAAGSLAGSVGVDQLADSFQTTGPVLADANLSLEESVAYLEVLGKFGLVASEGGNKFKGTIIALQKAGYGYASGLFNMRDALMEVNKETAKLSTAKEKDAYITNILKSENLSAGKILLNNISLTDQYTTAVTGTTSALEQQKIQNDNVAGSITKMTNKWDSFMLGISKSNGIIKGFFDTLSEAIDGATLLMMNNTEKQAMLSGKIFDDLSMKLQGMKPEDQIARINAILQIQEEQLNKTRKQIEDSGGEWDKTKNAMLNVIPVLDVFIDSNVEQRESLINQRDAIKQVIQKLIEKRNELGKTKPIIEENKKVTDENTEAINKNNKSTKDLILLKQKEIEEVQKVEATTKKELATRNDKLKKLEQELKALQNLTNANIEYKKLQSKEIKSIDITTDEEQQKKRYENAKKLGVDLQAIETDAMAKTKERLDAETELYRQQAEDRKQIEQDFQDSSITLIDTLFERRITTLENEKNAIDAKYAKILDNEELTEEQRSALEAQRDAEKQKLEEKQNKARRRQAIFDKAISLMNIWNSTKVAVMKAWEMGPVLGPVFAGLAAATGAIQAATVVAQPIPQYFKGTTNSKEGIAEVAEKGSELIIDKRHGAWLAEKRQHTYLSGGSTVLTASQTAQVLDNVRRGDIMAKSNDSLAQIPMLNKLLLDNISQGKSIEQAIRSNRNKTNIYLSPGVDKGLQVRAQNMYNHFRGN